MYCLKLTLGWGDERFAVQALTSLSLKSMESQVLNAHCLSQCCCSKMESRDRIASQSAVHELQTAEIQSQTP